jgi:hypothetical protein
MVSASTAAAALAGGRAIAGAWLLRALGRSGVSGAMAEPGRAPAT